VKNQKYEHCGLLNVKINFFFNLFNSLTIALRQMEVLYCKGLWTYLQVLFGTLFCLVKLLSIAIDGFEVLLGQALNHSVEFCNLCNVIPL
jgi:hypothetical protein